MPLIHCIWIRTETLGEVHIVDEQTFLQCPLPDNCHHLQMDIESTNGNPTITVVALSDSSIAPFDVICDVISHLVNLENAW